MRSENAIMPSRREFPVGCPRNRSRSGLDLVQSDGEARSMYGQSDKKCLPTPDVQPRIYP